MKNIFINLLKLFSVYISRTNWKSHYFNQLKKKSLDLSFDEIYKKIYKKNDNLIIFDIGANVGQSIIRFQKELKFKELHSFEPNTEAFEKLKKFTSSSIVLNNCALGDKDQYKDFYNYKKTSSSSFYKLNKKSSIYEINKDYNVSKIEIKTLDSYVKKNMNINKINILKIDTQGFEVDVLRGANDLIKNKKIDFIETEINLGFQYENRTSFKNIEDLLFDNYILIALKESGNIISNLDFQTNVIYANKEIINKFYEN